MLNRNLKFYVSVSAFATAIAAVPNGAHAQVAVAGQIPIADTQCSGGTFFHPLSQCEVTGTRTSTTPVRTATPNATIPGTSTFTHSEDVTFDGTLVVGGAALGTSPSSSFIIPPQFVYSPDAVSVDASLSYTGKVSAILPTATANMLASQPATALGQFQRYDIHDVDLRAINVDYRGEGIETKGGGGYAINLKSADPAAITDNSTALSGSFRGNNETGGLVFGKLGGTATVVVAQPNSAVFTPSPIALNEDGSPSSVFLSPMAVRLDVTSEETTRLDENGLVTPTIAVTDGINMNGSRITNLGDAVNGTDAVNLAQVNHLIATSSPVQNSEGDGALAGGTGSSANGNGAVALGQQQTANGNGAVAIGDPNTATGTGAVAIGADNTATGKGAVAVGNRNVASAQGAVALGSNSTASSFGNVAVGSNAEASGNGGVAIGSGTVASATGATVLGHGSSATATNAVALGYRTEATGPNATAVGGQAIASGFNSSAFGHNASATAFNSVAIGDSSVADQANTVSVGSAGAERRVVNVADAVNATDAVNKSQLDAEAATRLAADTTLQSNINAEASARAAAVTTLQNNINAEASARAAADTTLQNNINAEASARAAADTTLQNNVNAEASARAAADTTLQNNINTEASARAAADTTLQNNINTEASARAAADTTLQNNINTEAQTRATAVAALQTGLSNEASARAAGDIAEANARAAAENRLQTQINTLGTSLSSLTGRVTSLENNVRQDRKDARQGIAAAVAMTPAPMPSAPGKVAYTVNVANFRDEQAVAASLAMRLRGPNAMAITAGVAYGGGSNTAVRVGVAGEF